MSHFGGQYDEQKRIMAGMARKSAACLIGIPITFILSMALIVARGFGSGWYLALAATVLLTVLFVQNNRRFGARGGNAPELAPHVLPCGVSTAAQVRELLAGRMELFDTENGCSYGFLKGRPPVRVLLLAPAAFEEAAYRETYQEAICQILEGPNVPREVRADGGHGELRIHLIAVERSSPALEACLRENACRTMAQREGAMTAALLLGEGKLCVSAFFGDRYGDAKKYAAGCELLESVFCG